MRNASGISPNRWLREMFEFEYCDVCGGDERDHTVLVDVLGNFHARCRKPYANRHLREK